jgi:hypothetical protein
VVQKYRIKILQKKPDPIIIISSTASIGTIAATIEVLYSTLAASIVPVQSCNCTTSGRGYLEAVLRIHDILMWIRIRGSMPLTNGSGTGYFCH